MNFAQTAAVGVAAAALVGFGLYACSDSTGSSSGNCLNTLQQKSYVLDSIQEGGSQAPVLSPPVATGTLELRLDTLYLVNLAIQGVDPVYDSGHYCINANLRWNQSSLLDPTQPQSRGVYAVTDTTLFVDDTTATVETKAWWTKSTGPSQP
jgi:hypothetical protein